MSPARSRSAKTDRDGGGGGRAAFWRAFGQDATPPPTARAEVVFCGRSNVGKSSLLNALTGVSGLARTSKAPGRTREIHFYTEGDDRFLVDLPGYGFARASLAERRAWGRLIEAYLENATRVALILLLLDARHPPFDNDRQLAAWAEARELPLTIALTKADKLGRQEQLKSLRRAVETFPGARGALLVSARTGQGVADLRGQISGAVARLRAGAPGPAPIAQPRRGA